MRRPGREAPAGARDGGQRASREPEASLDGLRACGLRDPRLAIADGAGGFWRAPGKAFPATRYQRCWMHKAHNLAAMLPRRHKKQARSDPEEIRNAMDADEAKEAAEEFMGRNGRKRPGIDESLRKDLPPPLIFFDFPAERRKSIRSANTIEPMLSGGKRRARQARECLSPETATGMARKIGRDSGKCRRRLNGCRRLADVLESKPLKNGLPLQPIGGRSRSRQRRRGGTRAAPASIPQCWRARSPVHGRRFRRPGKGMVPGYRV